MRMNREGEGGIEGSLVELGERRARIADRQFKNQVVCTKNSNIKLFAKKFKHIYCKYLHEE